MCQRALGRAVRPLEANNRVVALTRHGARAARVASGKEERESRGASSPRGTLEPRVDSPEARSTKPTAGSGSRAPHDTSAGPALELTSGGRPSAPCPSYDITSSVVRLDMPWPLGLRGSGSDRAQSRKGAPGEPSDVPRRLPRRNDANQWTISPVGQHAAAAGHPSATAAPDSPPPPPPSSSAPSIAMEDEEASLMDDEDAGPPYSMHQPTLSPSHARRHRRHHPPGSRRRWAGCAAGPCYHSVRCFTPTGAGERLCMLARSWWVALQ